MTSFFFTNFSFCCFDTTLYFFSLDVSISDIIRRTQLPFIKNLQIKSPHEAKSVFKKRIKKEPEHRRSSETPVSVGKPSNSYPNHSSNSDSDSDSIIDAVTVPTTSTSCNSFLNDNTLGVLSKSQGSPVKIKEEVKIEPIDSIEETVEAVHHLTPQNLLETENSITSISGLIPSSYGEITPIKMEDLETIDIMNTPIELDNSEIDIMELSIKPELMQETHANFFSLIRDVICSTNEHRMNMYTLQERLKAWQENPISPLNDWYR